MRKSPIIIFGILAVLSYLADCLVAHKSHPDVLWIQSGIYCPGPFGIIATIVIVAVGAGYRMEKER